MLFMLHELFICKLFLYETARKQINKQTTYLNHKGNNNSPTETLLNTPQTHTLKKLNITLTEPESHFCADYFPFDSFRIVYTVLYIASIVYTCSLCGCSSCCSSALSHSSCNVISSFRFPYAKGYLPQLRMVVLQQTLFPALPTVLK